LDKIKPVLEIPGDRDDIPRAALPDRPHQRELTLEQRKEIIRAYYASITLMDACLGRVLDGLEKLKLADDTIVVFLSDHGYHLGHHGLWQKSDLFEGSARVPLIISVPGMKTAGQATASLTELVDLYPTLADLCGLPKPKHLKGQSLLPILADPKAAVRKAAYSTTRIRKRLPGLNGQKLGRSIRTTRYRYTEWNEGQHGVELYDYQNDPKEITNLARSAAHTATLKKMKTLFDQTRKHTK
jgi:arylsulfatase A-like enzyme